MASRAPTLIVQKSVDGSIAHEDDSWRALTDAENELGIDPFDIAYPPSNVCRYGAIADRITDCLPAFQMAAAISKYSGRILIPAAPYAGYYYKLSSTWILQNLDSVEVCGEGDTSCIVIANTDGFNAITVDSCLRLSMRAIGISGVDGSGNGLELINASHHCTFVDLWGGWMSATVFKVTQGISSTWINCRADRNNGYRPASLIGGLAEGSTQRGFYVVSDANGLNNNPTFVACQANACGGVTSVQIGDPGGLAVQSANWHGGLIQGSAEFKELYLNTKDAVIVGAHIEPPVGATSNYVVTIDSSINTAIRDCVITGDTQLTGANSNVRFSGVTGCGVDIGTNSVRTVIEDFEEGNITTGPAGGRIRDKGQLTTLHRIKNASNERFATGNSLASPTIYYATPLDTWVISAGTPTVPCGFTVFGSPTITREAGIVRNGPYSAKVVMGGDLTDGFQISPGPENAFVGKSVTVEAWVRNLTVAGLARIGMIEGGTAATAYQASYQADAWERMLVTFYPSESATTVTLRFTGLTGTVYWGSIKILSDDFVAKLEMTIDSNGTPNVSYGGCPVPRLLVGAGSDITNFVEPHVGRAFDLIWTSNRTLKNNASIVLKSGGDTVGTAGTTRRLTYGSDGVFREV